MTFCIDAFGNADGVGTSEQDGFPAIDMVIHTFGEYLDFHPYLHSLVADSLFDREGQVSFDACRRSAASTWYSCTWHSRSTGGWSEREQESHDTA